MTDPLLDRVAARARKQAHKRHSAAYRWLREHHAKLAPGFAAQKPPWREIAAELTAGGPGPPDARIRQSPAGARQVGELTLAAIIMRLAPSVRVLWERQGGSAVIPCYHQTYPALVPNRLVLPPSCPCLGTGHGLVLAAVEGQEGEG